MRRILAVIFLCVAWTAHADGGLDIYFVRHAETMANASGSHTSGNENLLSALGKEQVATLEDKLQGIRFDTVLVSPAPRALNTILPYLKATGQKGIIWPELTECCWQRDRSHVGEGRLVTGPRITLETGQEAYFTFRDQNATFSYSNLSYADGVAQVRHAEELLKQRFFGSGKTILIVAHYHSGQVLLADLLGITRDDLPGLENAKITHLRQDGDGNFTLLSINGEAVATTP